MKINKLVLLFCLLAFLAACSEDTFIAQTDENFALQENSIKYINIVVPEMEYTTSTRASFVDENDKLFFKWEEGDAAGVFPQVGSQVKFPVTAESVGGSSALFDGGQWALRADGKYAAYFPYDIKNEGIKDVIIDYTGQTQENFDEYDFMATGTITPTNGEITFNMQRLSAIVKVEIDMPAGTYGRYVRFFASPENMGVKGVMDLSGEKPTFVPSEYSNYIETDLLTDERHDEAWTLEAYLMIPPINMQDKTVRFTITSDKSDDVYETVLDGKNYEAGKAYKMTGVAESAKIRNLNLIAAAEQNEGVSFTKDENGFISISDNREELAKVTFLNVFRNDPTVCDEISFFPNLEDLLAGRNNIVSIDVSKNKKLKKLYVNENKLATLDVSKNKELTHLYCNYNQLTTLDVTHNAALQELRCGDNQLTTVDLSNNTDLTSLDIDNTQMKVLDLSFNTALIRLNCSRNKQLSSLDISNFSNLQVLSCYMCKLTSLDVSKNKELTTLNCEGNMMTFLDISSCPSLQLSNIYCGNQIDSTDPNTYVPLTLLVTMDQKEQSNLSDTSEGEGNYLVNVTTGEILTNLNLIAAAEANSGVNKYKP